MNPQKLSLRDNPAEFYIGMPRGALSMTNLIKRTVVCSVVVLFFLFSWDADAETQPHTSYYATVEKALTRGKIDEASRELKLALQADPLDSKAHYMLGSVLVVQGEEDQAMVGFRRAIVINPTHTGALYNLGTLLLRRGEAIPAAELLEAAVNFNPDYIPPYNNLAKAYYIAGLPELAIAAYQEVLRRDAVNPVARKNLALLLAETQLGLVEDEDVPKLPPTEKDKEAPPDPPPTEKDKEAPPDPPPKAEKDPNGKTPGSEALRRLLQSLPYLMVEEHDGIIAITGWTRGEKERKILDRILAKWPAVLDLTGIDSGDPQRMLEVDVVLFIVTGRDSKSIGFNFLRQISLSATYFTNQNSRTTDNKGLAAPSTTGNLLNLPAWGSLFVASINYDVNVANAAEDRVSVLARPHLTTLNGTPASFLAGGEIVFRVSGLETGDIKPYSFGTSLKVTPTLLRTPGESGAPRIHLNIEAQRTSVLEFLTAQAEEDSVVFDKLTVNSQAVLDLGQTLILSGLNQTEARSTRSGVPVLKSIPVIKYLFSQKTTIEETTAIIILLTPRDPAFNDNKNRKALARFVQKRRAFVKAQSGTKKDMQLFRKRYPGWRKLAPNRFASHFFLVEYSDLYRRVSGEDLIDEDLDLPLLEKYEEERKQDKEEKKINDADGKNNTN